MKKLSEEQVGFSALAFSLVINFILMFAIACLMSQCVEQVKEDRYKPAERSVALERLAKRLQEKAGERRD